MFIILLPHRKLSHLKGSVGDHEVEQKQRPQKHREEIFWIVVEKGRPLRFISVVNIFLVKSIPS